ncbi:MAG: hypothetical protein ABSH16_00920 [Sedimentisphaerales bacterium]
MLRVGADGTKNGGGFRSHICPKDRLYRFIPIPDKKSKLITSKALTYNDYKWNNQSVRDYLPPRIWGVDARNQYIHDDPEFKTFTYGSPRFNKKDDQGKQDKNYGTLEQMQKGDMLTFYAAFAENGQDIEGYYFFAYFIVDCVIKYGNREDLKKDEKALVKGNHHFIHRPRNQIIIKGDDRKSRFLERAVLLSSRKKDRRGHNYYPCKNMQKMLACKDMQKILGGYYKSMNFSSIRNICLPESGITLFKQYLDNNGG